MKCPRIIGAATVLASERNQLNHQPYNSLLPKVARDELLIDLTLSACDQVLSFANCRPDEIDLIISLSVSVSHFVDNINLFGPRITNPVQKELQADNAYVFDLLDSDWVFALDVAQTYAMTMDYKRVLIVRGECSAHSIMPDSESGFDLADGASALLLDLTSESFDDVGMRYIEFPHLIPAKILLANHIITESDTKSLLQLPYQASLLDDIAQSMLSLYQQTQTMDTVIYERWFDEFTLDSEKITHPIFSSHDLIQAPFDITSGLHDLLMQGKSSKVLLLTFDPFKMRVGGLSVYV